MARWTADEPGVLRLPSGRTLRGRSAHRPDDGGVADLTVRLAGIPPRALGRETVWIAWPDFGLPLDRRAAARVLVEAWTRSDHDRVDVSCRGGRGRTGTALACIAVLDGLDAAAAVALVRRDYDHRAVETPWQRRYVRTFDAARTRDRARAVASDDSVSGVCAAAGHRAWRCRREDRRPASTEEPP